MKPTYFIAAIFSFLSLRVVAQDTITTKVIVFDEDDMSKYDDSEAKYGKNAIKINPFLVLNGEVPIYYERTITGSLTGEVAIGITYIDYIGNLLDDDGNAYSETDGDQIHPNPSFKLGLRYYTGGMALDGFYFAVEYAKRKYAYTKQLYYSNNSTTNNIVTSDFKVENSINEFKIITGVQAHNYWDNVFIDYYGGVGIRNRNYTQIEDVYDENTFTTTPQLEGYKKSGPAFYLGLKIGFEF